MWFSNCHIHCVLWLHPSVLSMDSTAAQAISWLPTIAVCSISHKAPQLPQACACDPPQPPTAPTATSHADRPAAASTPHSIEPEAFLPSDLDYPDQHGSYTSDSLPTWPAAYSYTPPPPGTVYENMMDDPSDRIVHTVHREHLHHVLVDMGLTQTDLAPELPNAGKRPKPLAEPGEQPGVVMPASVTSEELADFGAAHVRLYLNLPDWQELRLLMVRGCCGGWCCSG
jgi:hypothetical protein